MRVCQFRHKHIVQVSYGLIRHRIIIIITASASPESPPLTLSETMNSGVFLTFSAVRIRTCNLPTSPKRDLNSRSPNYELGALPDYAIRASDIHPYVAPFRSYTGRWPALSGCTWAPVAT